MAVFAHKNDKSKFDLGNEADLTGIGDGTPFGAIKEIKSDLDDLRREAFMPVLDYDSPLYTFSLNNNSFTASKECYLVGTLGAGNLRISSISIDGKTPYTLKGQTNMSIQYSIPITKIGIGQVVSFTTNANDETLSSLFILDTVS